MRLSAARSAFLRPKARAISRVPILPGALPINARRSSLEGNEGLVWGRFISLENLNIIGWKIMGQSRSQGRQDSCRPFRDDERSGHSRESGNPGPHAGSLLSRGRAAFVITAFRLSAVAPFSGVVGP